jgi:acetyl-CoA carboxylase biotin carboxyl carrier protein
LDLKEIRQIIEMMKRHDLSLFHLERDGMKIKLKKGVDYDAFLSNYQGGGNVSHAPVQAAAPAPTMLPASAPVAESNDAPAAPSGSGKMLPSPMVGTFYRSANPGEAPFVKEGDSVSEGQTICIIEAMKVMNEIKAETSGVIARVVANDGTPVQYDQPLFELK